MNWTKLKIRVPGSMFELASRCPMLPGQVSKEPQDDQDGKADAGAVHSVRMLRFIVFSERQPTYPT